MLFEVHTDVAEDLIRIHAIRDGRRVNTISFGIRCLKEMRWNVSAAEALALFYEKYAERGDTLPYIKEIQDVRSEIILEAMRNIG